MVMVGNSGLFYFIFFLEVTCDCDGGGCGQWCYYILIVFVVGC